MRAAEDGAGADPAAGAAVRAAALLACVAAAACVPVSQDQLARDAARAAIRPVLAQTFPGLPVEPAVGCIIDNATADEILTLAAQAAAGGATPASLSVVNTIVARPETLGCLATEGLPALFAQGV